MKFKIAEFEPRFVNEVKDLIYFVLTHVGIDANKYPQIAQDIDPEHILKTYKERGRFWVAILNGLVVGTVAIEEKDTDTAKLKRMFVLPEYHGKGVGQALFEIALGFARTNGYKKITLYTDRAMLRAHRFYERNGFQRVGEDAERFLYEREI